MNISEIKDFWRKSYEENSSIYFFHNNLFLKIYLTHQGQKRLKLSAFLPTSGHQTGNHTLSANKTLSRVKNDKIDIHELFFKLTRQI